MTAERVVVAPASAYACELPRGGRCRVTDVDGHQVADVMFFCTNNYLERFSQSVTRVMNWSGRIGVDTTLYSNMQRPLAIVRIDTVGRHDTYFCSCSTYVYDQIYRVDQRPGCRENISQALSRLTGTANISSAVPEELLTDPLNCFQNSGFDVNGVPYLERAWSTAGDHIEFEALTDVIVAVSACPDDVSRCNGNHCTEIAVELSFKS